MSSPAADSELSLRRQLRLIIIAWLFGAIWWGTIGGAALNRFARELGMPEWGFGFLGASNHLGTLIALPVVLYLETLGRRKGVFLVTMWLCRLMWIVTAAIPWVIPDAGRVGWIALLAALLVSWTANSIAQPFWFSWMGDLIPRRIRGRFFSFRQRITLPLLLAATLGVGYVIDLAYAQEAGSPGTVLKVTSAVLALAGLFGTIDIGFFAKVTDPHPRRRAHQAHFLHSLRTPFADAGFRSFLMLNFLMILSGGYMNQYIWQYLFDVVGLSNSEANFLLIGWPAVLHLISYGLWGPLIDRLGKKPVLITTTATMLLMPVGWFIMDDHPAAMTISLLIISVSIFFYPGFEIANMNVLLDLSATRKGSGGGAYVAVHNIVLAGAGLLSGLIGSTIVAWRDGLAPTIPVLHYDLTYHRVMFLLTLLLRLIAIGRALTLREPRSAGTRDVISHMTTGLYSNIRETVLLPMRAAGALKRITYRLRGEKNRRLKRGGR